MVSLLDVKAAIQYMTRMRFVFVVRTLQKPRVSAAPFREVRVAAGSAKQLLDECSDFTPKIRMSNSIAERGRAFQQRRDWRRTHS
jgi:hypothetical protein